MDMKGQLPEHRKDLTQRLKEDVQRSASVQIASYEGIAPPEAIDAARRIYQDMASKFDLAPLSEGSRTKVTQITHLDSFADHYLGR